MREDVQKRIRKTLAKNHACYVLITCDEPTEDGEMQVEMTYEGDATVAAYLLQGATSFMEEEQDEDNDYEMPDHNKVHHL